MASQDDDHHSSNGNPRPAVPAQLLPKKAAPRNSDQVRRNRMNMEKMIMKNVAASRNSTKNRAQQIVEALKRKRQQQEDTPGTHVDEAERSAKRKKSSPPHGDTAARTAVAAGILSPARRAPAASGPNFTSPARRHNHPLNLKSPTPQQASPARVRGVNPLHLSSPVRPPRSSVLATSASPKRPLMFDDTTTDASAFSTRINGHPPLLSSALDQEEAAPAAKATKAVRAAKSPFQSFQAKFNKSPAKPPRMMSSPGTGGDSMQMIVHRSGPMMVDLAHPDDVDTSFLGGVHTVNTHFNIQNTTDIVAIHGQYGYGISLMGEAYRICFPDSSNLNSSCERLPRQVFELEKLGGGGISKSRRSNVMLESLAASDDGKTIVVVSSEGIFYYSNKLPDVGSNEEAHLRIIGKNASGNTLFKAPMKVYTPKIKTKDNKVKSEAMLAVVTNPSDEDSEEEGGYINVDPTEAFAARWMVPSRGQDCWVCGVRNASHWVGPPESKVKEPSRAQLEAQQKEQTRVKRRQERALQRVQNVAAQQQTSHNAHDQETPSPAKPKTTPRSSAKKAAVERQQNVQPDASGSGAVQSSNQNRRMSQHSGAGDDDDEDCTGSDDNTPSIASLMSELEHFKKRNAEIKTEWQRRLLGERQLRRKWKQREEEFLDQLNDSLTKLDAAEVEVDRLRVLLRDAEKRFAFEKARGEQENSVKSRYEQLCEQMNDKMALVADQKRLLEQTTRSLLAEVDRNVHALKNAVILEKTECVVCKDQQAVTAVVPCGHLCFCEQDAETYRRNCTTQYPTCPICQQEIVSLLRIYT
ncbi:hypothetical protein JG687_00003480 [Phytophthora cactorum]|uniref:RING-type domain-containing protein n=1 Tax=Phytophthora cactorum TaxID=29920 RepID=A0A8T1UUB4_9STRA|nr:hypothetical protein JG687_00003480 [Phytophthora cactorum]